MNSLEPPKAGSLFVTSKLSLTSETLTVSNPSELKTIVLVFTSSNCLIKYYHSNEPPCVYLKVQSYIT